MSSVAIARRVAAADKRPGIEAFLATSTYGSVMGRDDINDFVLGNPHEPPLPGFVEALRRHLEPRHDRWFSYTQTAPEAAAAVAAGLRRDRGLPYEPEDIAMTPGAFGALAAAMLATVDPGDEAVIMVPPWFNYEGMVAAVGGVPVKVPLSEGAFDLDVQAIKAALTPRTRLVIVNTPHNPTGRVYSAASLARLAGVLTRASERFGRPILLVSDEPYAKLVFDGLPFISPASFYPWTLISYSYGKVLLTPGQRLGWLAVTPTMPIRHEMRQAIRTAQVLGGWLFPNAVMQYAVPELEAISIDVTHLQAKRDRMVDALRGMGYEVAVPEGTFYMLPRSPLSDDVAFTELLAGHGVFVLPGTVCEAPGYFRISLTANDRMIEQSLQGFAAALDAVADRPP